MASIERDMNSALPPFKKRKLSPSSTPIMATTTQELGKDVTDRDPLTFSRGLSQADRETQVGILYFANSSNPGFSGILKKRYTDFIVNEISVDGQVLHLTDVGVPRKELVKTKKQPPVPSVQPQNTSPITTPTNPTSQASSFLETVTPPIPEDIVATMANPTATTTHPSPQPLSTATTTKPEAHQISFTVSPEDIELLVGYFGRSVTDQIITLHQKILSKPGAKASTFGFVVTEPVLDKSTRGAIHSHVRRIFQSHLETVFQVEDKSIKVTAAAASIRQPSGQAQSTRQQRAPGNDLNGKVGWNHLGGEFLHCVLYKENRDTMEVVNQLARSIGCKPKDITISGTKDRRAVTTQEISVYRQKPETLKRVAFNLFGAKVGNFVHKRLPLELGELGGNQFTITLREVDLLEINLKDKFDKLAAASAIVTQAMESLRNTGFINYFGLQRFGTHSIGTEVVGKMILQGDFKGAIFNGILECGNKDVALRAWRPDAVKSEKILQSVAEDDMKRYRAITRALVKNEYKEALEMMPRRFVAETAVLRRLKSNGKDELGALRSIPRSLLTMYVHAYQSLVFNHVASERYARYGTKIVEGDLVLINTKTRVVSTAAEDEFDESGEVIIRPAAHDASVTHDDIFDRARPLTAEEAESGKYTIFDVVLPTPGYDIEYPRNPIGDFYKTFMASEQGGGLDPANMRRPQKEFSLSGSYRHFMGRIGRDMSVDCKLYVDENQQFVETDLEMLVKKKNAGQIAKHGAAQGEKDTHKRSGSNASSTGSLVDKKSPNLRWTLESGLEEIPPVKQLEQLSSPTSTTSSRSQPTARQSSAYSISQIKPGRAAPKGSAPGQWGNAVQIVQADDKAKREKLEEQYKARIDSGSAFIAPALADTWIQTGGFENEGKRTGLKLRKDYETVNTKANGVKNDEAMAVDEVKQSAEEDNVGEVDNSEVMTMKEVGQPTMEKLAVIAMFSLPPSTYATMAIREASRGGVQPYQPTNA